MQNYICVSLKKEGNFKFRSKILKLFVTPFGWSPINPFVVADAAHGLKLLNTALTRPILHGCF